MLSGLLISGTAYCPAFGLNPKGKVRKGYCTALQREYLYNNSYSTGLFYAIFYVAAPTPTDRLAVLGGLDGRATRHRNQPIEV